MRLFFALKTLALAFFFILVSFTPATAENNEPALSAQLSKMIGSKLSLPSSYIRAAFNAEVKVDFRIKANGSLEVIRILNADSELKKHITEQFRSLRFSDVNIDTEKVYRLPVKYRVM